MVFRNGTMAVPKQMLKSDKNNVFCRANRRLQAVTHNVFNGFGGRRSIQLSYTDGTTAYGRKCFFFLYLLSILANHCRGECCCVCWFVPEIVPEV